MTDGARPFFSVVTATRNAEKDVAILRASVVGQTEQSWEWVVQDAASTDSTVRDLDAGADARIRVDSRKDRGIYDGLNRALRRAQGQYVLILGADDVLAGSDVLKCLRREIERATSPFDVLLCAAEVSPGRIFRSSLGLKTLITNTVHHQGAVYAASEFADFSFDVSVPVVADYEHSLRLFLQRSRARTSELLISRCGDEGVSRRTSERMLYADMHRLRTKYLPRGLSKLLMLIGSANVARRRLEHRLRPATGAGA